MFELVSKFKPSGDQPQAIEKLVEGIKEGKKEQVLLGATGTGKTFTVANVIKEVNKPTLVLAHNKTLAPPAIFGHPLKRLTHSASGQCRAVLSEFLQCRSPDRLFGIRLLQEFPTTDAAVFLCDLRAFPLHPSAHTVRQIRP